MEIGINTRKQGQGHYTQIAFQDSFYSSFFTHFLSLSVPLPLLAEFKKLKFKKQSHGLIISYKEQINITHMVFTKRLANSELPSFQITSTSSKLRN